MFVLGFCALYIMYCLSIKILFIRNINHSSSVLELSFISRVLVLERGFLQFKLRRPLNAVISRILLPWLRLWLTKYFRCLYTYLFLSSFCHPFLSCDRSILYSLIEKYWLASLFQQAIVIQVRFLLRHTFLALYLTKISWVNIYFGLPPSRNA